MKSYLNIDHWQRKEHFYFFKDFTEPFFGITTEIDCTIAYKRAKEEKLSLFLYYLYQSLMAANTIEAFRYRMEGERVAVYDTINASSTVPRPDGTFGFSSIPFNMDFKNFYPAANVELERVKHSKSLDPSSDHCNVIHYSVLPWISFTAISHARHYGIADSVPKISFGKISEKDRRKVMPVSIHVHHALMDGYHVGEYLELFQELMNKES